jgi:hypothetical protein
MFHPTIPWARATPDGWRENDPGHLAQIKVIGFFVGKEWKRELPIEIECQLQWEMFVAGAVHGINAHTNDLAILSGTDEILWERLMFGAVEDPHEILATMQFEIVPIYRSEGDIAELDPGAERFMRMVERDEQPDVDHSDGCRDYMNGRRAEFPILLSGKRKGQEQLVTLPYNDYAEIVDELGMAHSEHKTAERRYKTACNAAVEALVIAGANRIATAPQGEDSDGPIVYTSNKQLRVPKAWNSEENT